MGPDRYYSSVLRTLAALVLVSVAAPLASAAPGGAKEAVCSIPVFRYALERWRVAPYPGVLFHKGPLAAEARSLLAEIDASHLNLAIEPVDVSVPLSDELRKLWEPDAPLPRLVLTYPDQPEAVAWRGAFDPANVRGLIDSPRRRETIKLLTAGTSVVWWLFESGDAAKDKAAAELMTRELARLEQDIKIPLPGPDDPPLRSAIPLKVAFTLIRVPPASPLETAFAETLSRARRDWTLPAVVPMFGRGRALGSLCGAEINADLVSRMAEYVTDACSCEVKELNPGVDLLFAADWEELLEAGPAPPEPDLKAPPVTLQLPKPRPPSPSPDVSALPPTSPPSSRHLLWAGLGAALLIAVAAGALAFRKGT
jgi:hypothetical protein